MRFAGQRAPAPLRVGDLPDGGSYIVMELLDLKPFALLDPAAQRLLGRGLARMHMHQPDRHAFFGFGLETKASRDQRGDVRAPAPPRPLERPMSMRAETC